MGAYCDVKDIERILQCPAGKKRLENVVNSLEGSTFTDVRFKNCANAIGVLVKLNRNHELLIHLPCLSLDELMEDPEIRAQIKELYYQEYPERRPEQDTGKE